MRKFLRTSAVAAVLLMVSALTSAAVPAHSATRGAHGFWYVAVPGESFAGAVRHAVGASGGQVAATVRGMIRQVEAGKRVLVPEGTRDGVRLVPATVPELRAALATAGRADARARVGAAGRLSVTVDPHTFDIRGQGCNPVTWRGSRYWASWCKIDFEIDGGLCDPTCHNTDVLKTRLLVDPGTNTSRVSRTSTYSYQAGDPNFSMIHIEWWTLCFSSEQICGNANTPSFFGNSNDTFSVTSSRDLHNSRIRHAFTLWAFFVPTNQWQADDAKTWKGICKPKNANSNQCLYPA
jgi:hypothetical protein